MAFLPEDKKTGKLMGNYLTNCIGSSLPLLYSWVAANYAGHTKKVRILHRSLWPAYKNVTDTENRSP